MNYKTIILYKKQKRTFDLTIHSILIFDLTIYSIATKVINFKFRLPYFTIFASVNCLIIHKKGRLLKSHENPNHKLSASNIKIPRLKNLETGDLFKKQQSESDC